MMHPRSVSTIQMNGKPVDEDILSRAQLFLFAYRGVSPMLFAPGTWRRKT